MKYVVRCTCGGVKTKMEAAMKLIDPDGPMPEEVKGSAACLKLAEKWPHTPFGDYLLTIAKKHGRYCIYLSVTEKGEIEDARDLMTGRRLV